MHGVVYILYNKNQKASSTVLNSKANNEKQKYIEVVKGQLRVLARR